MRLDPRIVVRIFARGFAVLIALLLPLACPAQTHSAHKAAAAAETTDSATIKNVFWQPNQLLQGSPAFFTVELSRPAVRVSATFVGKRLSFFKGEKPDVWYALGGDDLETKPDSYDGDGGAAEWADGAIGEEGGRGSGDVYVRNGRRGRGLGGADGGGAAADRARRSVEEAGVRARYAAAAVVGKLY